jgi:hypothetical protein
LIELFGTLFFRDRDGLKFDPENLDLVESPIEPRYIDATIIDQGEIVCDIVISKIQGGLGDYLYICGSVSVYETVNSGIRQALYNNRSATKESASTLLATAFAERRFMLGLNRFIPINSRVVF